MAFLPSRQSAVAYDDIPTHIGIEMQVAVRINPVIRVLYLPIGVCIPVIRIKHKVIGVEAGVPPCGNRDGLPEAALLYGGNDHNIIAEKPCEMVCCPYRLGICRGCGKVQIPRGLRRVQRNAHVNRVSGHAVGLKPQGYSCPACGVRHCL